MNRLGTLTIIVIFLVVSGGLLLGFGLPLWQTIQAALNARDRAEAAANDLEAQRERLSRFVTQKAEYEQLRYRLEEAIPGEPRTDQLVINLERLATALGLRLNLLSIESGKAKDKNTVFSSPPPGVTPVLVTVDVAGPYPAIQNWVRQLALSDRLTEVDNLVLSDQAEVGVDARMTLRTFWKAKRTVGGDTASLAIDAKLRGLLLAPRDLVTLPPAANPESGRPDPFAAVP